MSENTRDGERHPVEFIEYPPCSTCKKARAWLEEHGVEFVSRHIVEHRPEAGELRAWSKLGGIPVRKLFNTSGRLYRERGVKALLDAGMSDDEAIELLASDGMMVKRPIVVGANFVLVGFREDAWAEKLA